MVEVFTDAYTTYPCVGINSAFPVDPIREPANKNNKSTYEGAYINVFYESF